MSSHSTRMTYLGSRPSPAKGRMQGLASAWSSIWGGLRAMVQARQTRRLLAGMDDRMLADIGLGRGDALMEANRSMWDIEQAVR